MSTSINIRSARRSDLPELARIANAGNAQSALHHRMALYQDQHPIDYYRWRLNIMRLRSVSPEIRTIVAVNTSDEILGLASWAVEGPETALYKQWMSQGTWSDWLDSKLIRAERLWCHYMMDKSLDHTFHSRFLAAFMGSSKPKRPPCLHCHLIVVDPSRQSRGVGRTLINWGKELAVKEDLPLFLEATLEATGFYEKGGFSRLTNDLTISPDGQEDMHIPVYVWEGEQRKGRWLQRDESCHGAGQRWKWRDDVLLQ